MRMPVLSKGVVPEGALVVLTVAFAAINESGVSWQCLAEVRSSTPRVPVVLVRGMNSSFFARLNALNEE